MVINNHYFEIITTVSVLVKKKWKNFPGPMSTLSPHAERRTAKKNQKLTV